MQWGSCVLHEQVLVLYAGHLTLGVVSSTTRLLFPFYVVCHKKIGGRAFVTQLKNAC
jgi:hypothetical protein